MNDSRTLNVLLGILGILGLTAVGLEVAGSKHTLEIVAALVAAVVVPSVPVLLNQQTALHKTKANTEEIKHALNGEFAPRVKAIVDESLEPIRDDLRFVKAFLAKIAQE